MNIDAVHIATSIERNKYLHNALGIAMIPVWIIGCTALFLTWLVCQPVEFLLSPTRNERES